MLGCMSRQPLPMLEMLSQCQSWFSPVVCYYVTKGFDIFSGEDVTISISNMFLKKKTFSDIMEYLSSFRSILISIKATELNAPRRWR